MHTELYKNYIQVGKIAVMQLQLIQPIYLIGDNSLYCIVSP